MNGDYDPIEPNSLPPRRSLLRWMIVPGMAFILGLGAMGYILAHWNSAARVIGIAPEAQPASVAAAPAPATAPGAPPNVRPNAPVTGAEPEQILIDPDLARRVAALESRIGQVDTNSRAAVGNADRAEGLLVAFAARRALDRGVPLGFLEALLRQRFGDTQPQAVGMVITAAREPVTLQNLQDELAQLGPQLIGAGPDQSWWGAFRDGMGSLVTIRRRGTPSTVPTERLTRATRWLEAGQVDLSMIEVQRMPGAGHAEGWAMKARRYWNARRALDTIETAALLEPRAAQAPAAAVPAARPAHARPR